MGLGHGPSDLDQYNKEVRGSFAVRVFGASGQPELEISRVGVVGQSATPLGFRSLPPPPSRIIYLSIYLSICLSIYLSIYLHIHMYVYVHMYLYIYVYMYNTCTMYA